MSNKLNINQSKKILIIYIVLIVGTLAVFWQVNKFNFVDLDDFVYVTENFHVTSGITLNSIRWAFSTTYAEFWHPLTWLSLMLDYQLYGLNAGGYNLTNLILHILSTLLLFWLFNRMTKEIWKSAFVATFFALHPLHVESVAWISERKDVLSAFFWMLTICFYVYYTEKQTIKRYLLVLFSFMLALMSKPMVITLPVIMILLDYWPLSRCSIGIESQKSNLFLWQLKEKISFFILSAIITIVTIFAQHDPSGTYFPFVSRLANAPIAFVTYLGKTFWPYDLAIFYPFPSQIPIWQVMGATFLIIIVITIVITMAKRLPYLFVGWLWYTVIIMPVIGIIQVGNHSMADRFTYLPLIGIPIGLAWGVPLLFSEKKLRKTVLFPMTIAMLLVLATLAWQQCHYWKNSISLFDQTLRVTKNNYIAHGTLGIALFKEGKIKEAIDHYNKAILIRPDYSKPYDSRGIAYNKLGQYQQALEDFNIAIRLNNEYAYSYNNRGAVYDRLGQYQQAIEDYNTAIHLKEDYADAYNNRGIVYSELGQHQKAIKDFSKAIGLNPAFMDAHNNRAIVYLNTGDTESGCHDAKKVCTMGNCSTLQAARTKGLCH